MIGRGLVVFKFCFIIDKVASANHLTWIYYDKPMIKCDSFGIFYFSSRVFFVFV